MNISSALLFTFGAIVQCLLLPRVESDFKKSALKFLGIAAFTVFALVPGKREIIYNWPSHIIYIGLLFSVVTAIAFKEQIIPSIDERMLLGVNLVTMYLILRGNFPSTIVLIYYIITLIIILNAIVSFKLPKPAEIILFIWYFILILTVPVAHFGGWVKHVFEENAQLSYDQLLVAGSLFAFIIVHIMYLLALIPFPGKHETMKQAIERVKEHMSLLNRKFHNTQFSMVQGILFTVTIVVLLGVNAYFSLISDNSVLALVLVVCSLWYKVNYRKIS